MFELFVKHWDIIIFIAVIIFNSGYVLAKLKAKPSEQRVTEMIKDANDDHCPFVERIEVLETWKENKIVDTQKKERVMQQQLDTIIIHLKQVCEKLDIKWQNPSL